MADPRLLPAARTGSVPVLEQPLKLDTLFHEYFSYVWRLLRRLGLPEQDADDAAQRVFIVASKRMSDIVPNRERAFLYKIAWHIAAKQRRTVERRRENSIDELDFTRDEPEIEELLDQRRSRQVLDGLLEAMPLDQRAVFVLYEIEELTCPEIADVLGIPVGTVASRLRRARADFQARVARLGARRKPKERP